MNVSLLWAETIDSHFWSLIQRTLSLFSNIYVKNMTLDVELKIVRIDLFCLRTECG